MKFNNKKVAGKYLPAFDADRKIHMPCCFQGMLSDIPLSAADKLFETGSNLLVLKESTKTKKESRNIEDETVTGSSSNEKAD